MGKRQIAGRAGLRCLLRSGAGLLLAAAAVATPLQAAQKSWHEDPEAALERAQRTGRLVFMLFTTDPSPICAVFKDGPLQAKRVSLLLAELELVEVSLLYRAGLATDYGVTELPAVRILTPDMRVVGTLDGFAGSQELVSMILEASISRTDAPDASERLLLLEALESHDVPDEMWPEIARLMGLAPLRARAELLLSQWPTLPKQRLVGLLSAPELAVRLGALDLLESLTGDYLGYDPWLEQDEEDARAALARWAEWAGGELPREALTETMTDEQVEQLITELLTGSEERQERAFARLVRGPGRIVPTLRSAAVGPRLPPGSARRLREAAMGIELDSADLAHRLLWGGTDARLAAIHDLDVPSSVCLSMSGDLLSETDPLIREAVVEKVIEMCGEQGGRLVSTHLVTEEDVDVIYAALRAAAEKEVSHARALMLRYVADANEDLAVAALDGLSSIEGDVPPEIRNGLDDPRWRVRVGALQLYAKRGLPGLGGVEERIVALVEDEDDFVRQAAVDVICKRGIKAGIPALRDAYERHEEMHAAVIVAYLRLGKGVPDEWVDRLVEEETDALLSVLSRVENLRGPALSIALRAMASEDQDVSCTALSVMASSDARGTKVYEALAGSVLRGTPEQQLAVLRNFSSDSKTTKQMQIACGACGGNAPLDPDDEYVDDSLVGRLTTGLEAMAMAEKPTASRKLAAAAGVVMRATDTDPRVKTRATLLRAGYGCPEALKGAIAQWSSLGPTDQRSVVAGNCLRGEEGVPFYRQCLTNASSDIVQAALHCLHSESNFCSDESRGRYAVIAMDGLIGKADGVLAAQLWGSGIRECGSIRAVREHAVAALRRAVGEGISDASLVPYLALVASYGWQRGGADIRSDVFGGQLVSTAPAKGTASEDAGSFPLAAVEECLVSGDAAVRRVAWFALYEGSTNAFEQNLRKLVQDPSPHVRKVLSEVRRAETEHGVHVDLHFTEDIVRRGYYGLEVEPALSSRNYYGSATKVSELRTAAFEALVEDEEAAVRIGAHFALLSMGQPVDLEAMVKAVNSFLVGASDEERESVSELAYRFFSSNSYRTGPEFEPLLVLLDGADESWYRRQGQELRERWANRSESSTTTNTNVPEGMVALASEEGNYSGHEYQEPVPVPCILFVMPGCAKCAAARSIFSSEYYTEYWTYTEYSLRDPYGLQLNQVLCERFDVPRKQRGVAPMLFAPTGYLAGDDIDLQQAWQLMSDAQELLTEEQRSGKDTNEIVFASLQVTTEQLSEAEQELNERADATTIGMMLWGGLSDGVNPCAFATLLFLLSYLRLMKRTPRQILQVGVAFVLGVFIVYLLLGIGLAEILDRVPAHSVVGWLFNKGMAVGSLVLAFLSIQDAIKVRKGKAKEMLLQLPERMKKGVHAAVRQGARHRKFVLASFVLGIVVSLLELVCTGQIYAPMIAYMLSRKETQMEAVGYLVIYNIAFVLPLIVVFAATAGGISNERLQKLFSSRLATIKILTAVFFFAMFIYFATRGQSGSGLGGLVEQAYYSMPF